LHAAVEGGHFEIVKLLLNSGAPINFTRGKYGSLLQVAALNTPEPIALLLLERGIDVNIQAGHFGNALQAWSYVGNVKIVELLIRKGADVNARGGAYETALIGAVAGEISSQPEHCLTLVLSFSPRVQFMEMLLSALSV